MPGIVERKSRHASPGQGRGPSAGAHCDMDGAGWAPRSWSMTVGAALDGRGG